VIGDVHRSIETAFRSTADVGRTETLAGQASDTGAGALPTIRVA
jgi:hypothetical protein